MVARRGSNVLNEYAANSKIIVNVLANYSKYVANGDSNTNSLVVNGLAKHASGARGADISLLYVTDPLKNYITNVYTLRHLCYVTNTYIKHPLYLGAKLPDGGMASQTPSRPLRSSTNSVRTRWYVPRRRTARTKANPQCLLLSLKVGYIPANALAGR